jgi:L-ribulokinase
MLVAGSPQTPALGAAVSAAVAAGTYPGFEAAQARMTSLKETAYAPDPADHAVYDELYRMYRELHDTFGGVAGAQADLATLMKRLLAVRERQAR